MITTVGVPLRRPGSPVEAVFTVIVKDAILETNSNDGAGAFCRLRIATDPKARRRLPAMRNSPVGLGLISVSGTTGLFLS